MGYDDTKAPPYEEIQRAALPPQPLPPPPVPAAPAAPDTTRWDDRYGFPNHPPPPNNNRLAGGDLVLYIMAVFIPPVPVFLKAGCGCDLLINICLWALCWIPGVLHAVYIVTVHNVK